MANEALLFAVPCASGGAVVEPRRDKSADPYNGRELPWEGGEPLFLLNSSHKMRYRVVEIHQERHLCFAAGGERRADKSRLDDRHIYTFRGNIEPDALKKCRHRRLAG